MAAVTSSAAAGRTSGTTSLPSSSSLIDLLSSQGAPSTPGTAGEFPAALAQLAAALSGGSAPPASPGAVQPAPSGSDSDAASSAGAQPGQSSETTGSTATSTLPPSVPGKSSWSPLRLPNLPTLSSEGPASADSANAPGTPPTTTTTGQAASPPPASPTATSDTAVTTSALPIPPTAGAPVSSTNLAASDDVSDDSAEPSSIAAKPSKGQSHNSKDDATLQSGALPPGIAAFMVSLASSSGNAGQGGSPDDGDSDTEDPSAPESPISATGAPTSSPPGAATPALSAGTDPSSSASLLAPLQASPLVPTSSDSSGSPVPSSGSHSDSSVDAANSGTSVSQAMASMVQNANANAPSSTAANEHSISVPVTDRSWPQAVSNTVQWLTNHNVQAATLRLSPEHLGPLEVHINVQDSQVNVSFTAAHPDTRVALEQAVPKLREMFAGSGLTLGQASVQQDSRSGSQSSASRARLNNESAQSSSSVTAAQSLKTGMVDEYA